MADVYKNAAAEATRICEDSSELAGAAAHVLAVWTTVAIGHSKTGHYVRSLQVKRDTYRGPNGRGKDYVVYTDDPNAMQIEYGHRLYRDTDRDGIAEDLHREVEGLHIGSRAFDILKAGGR